ncbi:MAG: peroxidase-related enzyme [Armatimonadota bacterium]|nr:peroxidase-related enzyme [Armatimonadota bacterium]MDW8155592.1 peroxidase-related enzyme [Armatimonadota bacterium]
MGGGQRLAWIRVAEEAEVPEQIRELARPAVDRLGILPHVFRVFSLRPEHCVRWWQYYDYLMRGPSNLTKVQREMIAVVVSSLNRCHYCSTSHGAALRLLTEDPVLADTLATDYRHAPLEHKDRAMLDFAAKLTTEPHRMTEEDVQALRAAGWTDEDVFDIAQVAAMFNFTNRLANALGWHPNPEYHRIGR